jgi:membrane-bound lytic murein transglycosylase A
LLQPDGGVEGLATGYYEPQLRGSRTPTARYRFPVYGVPDDLLVLDLPAFSAEPRDSRARARIDGKRVVPYFDRAQIEAGVAPVRGKEIAWVDDPVELFFLQIQGSGRLDLENGGVMRLGYADHNGHPYRSIGRLLIDRGELTADRASMQGIKAWAQQNPDKLRAVLDYNPRYVFFRELPQGLSGPLGAQGVPLTARRSIAVDPRFVPLGTGPPPWPLRSVPESTDATRHRFRIRGAVIFSVMAIFIAKPGMKRAAHVGAVAARLSGHPPTDTVEENA